MYMLALSYNLNFKDHYSAKVARNTVQNTCSVVNYQFSIPIQLMFNTNKTHYFTIFLFTQYVFVTLVMMYFYHAGHFFDHQASHFLLHQNYLSDLGRSIGFSGLENNSYIFYTITLSLVGIGIILYYLLLANTVTNNWKYPIILIGFISGIAYIGIAINPVNESLTPHLFFGKLAFFAFFIASIGMHILLNKDIYPRINKYLYLLNIMLFFYLLLMLFGPRSSVGIWALQLKTISQKIVVYTLMLSAIFILKELSAKLTKPLTTKNL